MGFIPTITSVQLVSYWYKICSKLL